MAAISDHRRRLADLMERRRVELGLRWKEVAVAGGISYEAIRAVRNGDAEIRALTKHGIDVGLQWAPGSVQRILDGGEPADQPVPVAEPPRDYSPAPPPDPDELGTWERQVWIEVTDALARYGSGATGTQVFPGSAVEASVWDTRKLPDREAKVRLIAKLRAISDESSAESRAG